MMALAIMAFGIVLANVSAALQQSDMPGTGLAGALLGLASLLCVACPASIGATWVVERVQRGRRRSGSF